MKILVVEDDKLISQAIKDSLSNNYDIIISDDGEVGLYTAKQNIYDVIILDIMLPHLNGYEVLKSLRKDRVGTPVLFLTSKDSIEDKLKGFKLGADDYIVKPFHLEELRVRVDALLKRSGAISEENILIYEDIKFDLKTKELFINDKNISLQLKQYDLFEYLVLNKGTILTKEQIFDRVWGFESETTINVVEVYIHKLRKLLSPYNYDKYIITLRGIGYMFKISEDKNV